MVINVLKINIFDPSFASYNSTYSFYVDNQMKIKKCAWDEERKS